MREDLEGNERRLEMKELRGKSTRKAQKERVQIKVEELRQVEGCKNPTGKQRIKRTEKFGAMQECILDIMLFAQYKTYL
jgi:hypothetical protein